MSRPCWTQAITLTPGEQLNLVLGEMTGNLTLSGRTHPSRKWVSLDNETSRCKRRPDPPPETKNTVATLSDIDGYFEFDHVEEGEYRVEIGEMDFFRGRMRFKTSDKGPAEIFLVEDTHVEYVTGEVTPPESAVEGS